MEPHEEKLKRFWLGVLLSGDWTASRSVSCRLAISRLRGLGIAGSWGNHPRRFRLGFPHARRLGGGTETARKIRRAGFPGAARSPASLGPLRRRVGGYEGRALDARSNFEGSIL